MNNNYALRSKGSNPPIIPLTRGDNTMNPVAKPVQTSIKHLSAREKKVFRQELIAKNRAEYNASVVDEAGDDIKGNHGNNGFFYTYIY
jgi:hypothetical protein